MVNPNDQDMFEYLPESLLFIILSLLPFQDAANTSVLSRQWRRIWYATHNIEFYESSFVKPEHAGAEREKWRLAFLHFIQKWIQMNGHTKAQRFCLSFSRPQNHARVLKKCIKFATERKVEFLDLDFSDPTWHDLGDYNEGSTVMSINLGNLSNELVSLRLFSCDFVLPEAGKTFNALRRLTLGWIKLSGDTLQCLLKGLPSLVNLNLKNCWGLDNFVISGLPNLKHLVLDKCYIRHQEGLVVDAKKLESFNYSGFFVPFRMAQIGSVFEYRLDFTMEPDLPSIAQAIYDHIIQLSSAKVLSVCGGVLQVIHLAHYRLLLIPQLENMHKLILRPTALHDVEYFGISFFLTSFPNLEVLVICLDYTPIIRSERVRPPYRYENHPFVTTAKHVFVFDCVRTTLRVVEVYGYRGFSCEERVLQYLLKHGKILEEMRIHFATDGYDNVAAAQRLLLFQRASPNLRIAIM